MYPLRGGNTIGKEEKSTSTMCDGFAAFHSNGTYLNKLDKFGQYQRRKMEKTKRKKQIERTLNEMNLDLQVKQTLKNSLNLYDSPKLMRQPLNNYFKKNEVEVLKEKIIDLKTEISEQARDKIYKSRPPLLLDKSKINNIKVNKLNNIGKLR